MSDKLQYTDKQIKGLLDGIYSGEITEHSIPESLYTSIAEYLKKGLYKGFGGTLVDFKGKDLELLTELRENVYMFSAAKSYQEVKQINSLMFDADGLRVSQNEFNKLGAQTFETWNEAWGRSEYNTATAQGMAAIKWQEAQRNKDLLPYLTYHTIGDACAICAPLDGMTARVDDKIWSKVFAPNHFNCLCITTQEGEGVKITPDADKEIIVDAVDKEMSDMFKMNAGKDKYVFSPEHPYFQVSAKDVPLAKNNFGLPIPPAAKEVEKEKKEKPVKKDSSLEKIEKAKADVASFDFTEAEKKSVTTYTKGNYSRINEYLRGQSYELSPDNFNTVKELNSFMQKAPKVKAETYRGVTFESKKGLDDFLKLTDGGVFSDKGFLSTTYDKKMAESFTNSDPFSVLIKIKGKSGVTIENLSDMKNEKEILFNRNTAFKIEKTKVTGGGNRVELTLIEL